MINKFVQKGFLYDTLNKIIDKINNSENNVSKNYQAEVIMKDGNYYINPLNFNFSDFKTLDDLPNTINIIINVVIGINITMTKTHFNINGNQEEQYVYYIFNFQASAFMNIVILNWDGFCQIDTNMIDNEFYYNVKIDYDSDIVEDHLSINGSRNDYYNMIYDEDNNEIYNVEQNKLYYNYKPLVTFHIDNVDISAFRHETFVNLGYNELYLHDGAQINVNDFIGYYVDDMSDERFYTYNPTENENENNEV